MCGNDGIFHGPITRARISLPFSRGRLGASRGFDPFGHAAKPKPKTPADELADAEAQAAEDANAQVAANRRRRLRASLFAGGTSVLGAPAGSGAPAGAGTPATSAAAGGSRSAMGGARSRSYGGSGGFTGAANLP